MRAMLALIRREAIEHRGAFLFAPAVLLALFTLAGISAVAFHRVQLPFDVGVTSALRFFEIAFLGMAALWFVYMIVALFFYFADAFNADRRNNAMLFWKSMPVSDFKVLMSKLLAGLTLLPAQIFVMLIATCLVLYGLTAGAVFVLPNLSVPGVPDVVASTVQLALYAFVYMALALLWYAPFFAWVGALSTLVGRWSIPLAFLVPALIGLAENVFLDHSGPGSGYILDYLRQRSRFGPLDQDQWRMILTEGPFDALAMIGRLLASIDWAQMAGGLAAAAVLVYLASEYRRRAIVA